MPAKFDSDTAALVARENINSRLSAYDLEQWILEEVKPTDGIRVLDLGCGTGKQTFRLATRFPGCSIVSVDVSAEAVAAVNHRARMEGITTVRAIRSSFDEVLEMMGGDTFDLVLSAYALYYASDMGGLMARLTEILNPGGQVFVCGPGRGTNQEMVDLINEVCDDKVGVPAVEDFASAAVLAALEAHYADVSLSRLANSVEFQSIDDVLQWWRSHNSYRADLEAAVAQKLVQLFEKDSRFVMTKNVLGVHCKTR